MMAYNIPSFGPEWALVMVAFPAFDARNFDGMSGPQMGSISRFSWLAFVADVAGIGVTLVLILK